MYKLLTPKETAQLIEAYYELFKKTKGKATVKLEKYGRDDYCAICFTPKSDVPTVNIGGVAIPTEKVGHIEISETMLEKMLIQLFREYGLEISSAKVFIEHAKGYDSREWYPKEEPAKLKGITIDYELINKIDDANTPRR